MGESLDGVQIELQVQLRAHTGPPAHYGVEIAGQLRPVEGSKSEMPRAWGDGKDGRMFYIHEAGAEEKVNLIDWELDGVRLETSLVPLQLSGSGSKEVSVLPR